MAESIGEDMLSISFDKANDQASTIQHSISKGIPEDATQVWAYARQLISGEAEKTQEVEIALRQTAALIDQHLVSEEVVDRLRIIEAKRVKAVKALKKCLVDFFDLTVDMDERPRPHSNENS